MSSEENKVEVITEFLQRTARLGRVTNFREVQSAAGLALAEKGYRKSGSSMPVDRYKVAEALGEIAKTSYAQDGLILPALVVHFTDKKPGHRFAEWAGEAGLLEGDADVLSVHADQVAKIHAKYQAEVSV